MAQPATHASSCPRPVHEPLGVDTITARRLPARFEYSSVGVRLVDSESGMLPLVSILGCSVTATGTCAAASGMSVQSHLSSFVWSEGADMDVTGCEDEPVEDWCPPGFTTVFESSVLMTRGSVPKRCGVRAAQGLAPRDKGETHRELACSWLAHSAHLCNCRHQWVRQPCDLQHGSSARRCSFGSPLRPS